MHRGQKKQDHNIFHNRKWAFFLSFKLCGTKQFQMWLCSACETRVFDMKPYVRLLSFDKSQPSKKKKKGLFVDLEQ